MPKETKETKETSATEPEYHLMVPTLRNIWDDSHKRRDYLELGLAQLEGFQGLLEGAESSALTDAMLNQYADFLGNHSPNEIEAFKKQFKQYLPHMIAEEFALSAEETFKKTNDDSPVKKVRFKFRSPLGKKTETKTDLDPDKYLKLLKKQISEKLTEFEKEQATDITVTPKKGITVEQDLEAKHRPLEQFQKLYHSELQSLLPAIKQNEAHQNELFEQCANVFNAVENIQKKMDQTIKDLELSQSHYHLDPNYYQTKQYEEYHNEEKLEPTTTIQSKRKNLPIAKDAEIATLRREITRLNAELKTYQNMFITLPHSEVSIPGLTEQEKFGYLKPTQSLEQSEAKKLSLPDALLQQKKRIDAAETHIKAKIKTLEEKMLIFDSMISSRTNFEQRLQAYRQREKILLDFFKKDVGVFPVYLATQHLKHPILDAASANLNPLNIFGSRHCRQERRQDYMIALMRAMQNYVNDESKAVELISVIREGWGKQSTNLHNVLKAFLGELENQSPDFKALVEQFEAESTVKLHT